MAKNKAPQWLENAIFYQIYPQSFADSNGDGIGDIPGIIDKLDYIASLGCNGFWLNPCFVSPFGDAGYDVADFCKVAPRYGTNADLARLFKEAKKRGIHICLDLVPGHTSVDHPWFKESAKPEPNPHSHRYIWTQSVNEEPNPPLRGVRGYSERDGVFVSNYFYHQPALNCGFYKPDPNKPWQLPMDHPEAQATAEEIWKVMQFWLKKGASGFRVDMASSLVKGDTPDKKGNTAFWKKMRTRLEKEFPEAVLISEWGNPSQALPAGFHVDFLLHMNGRGYNDLFRMELGTVDYQNPKAHSFFNPRGKGNVAVFMEEFLEHLRAAKRHGGFIGLPTSNHDMARIALTRTPEDLRLAYLFIYTLPVIPFLYYGDEIGMTVVEGLKSKEGGYLRTGSRTPMQWSSAKNGGFSSAAPSKLYLPLDPDPNRPTVADQEKDPDSLLHFVQALAELRQSCPALQGKGFEPLYAGKNQYPLVFRRYHRGRQVLVALNPANRREEAVFADPAPKGREWKPLWESPAKLTAEKGRKLRIQLPARGWGLFHL